LWLKASESAALWQQAVSIAPGLQGTVLGSDRFWHCRRTGPGRDGHPGSGIRQAAERSPADPLSLRR